ncbi:uncharacterized protein FA14DRAFT_114933, partial [Meira miltonrushii]
DAKKPKPTRGAKACKNCRRLKMRCVGAESGPPCDRCKNTNHECIFEESNRGKKSGKYQRTEAMAASLRKMEATMSSLIQSLKDPSKAFSASAGIMTRSPTPEGGVMAGGARFVEPELPQRKQRASSPRLHSLPDNTLNPLGLLAEATSSARSEAGREKVETPKVGVASETYFKPGPMTILPLRKIVIERELAPDLLTQGIVTSEEVLELFQVFFHNCSQHVVLFDPDWHTPTMVCGRSPFLFTVICTIASKYYKKRPDLHQQCLEVVRKCAYVVMSRGFKSVEIVQGFLLLSVWQTPSQRFEEDKTWLFSGVAIRMATDLNLHRKSMASIPNTTDSEDPAVLEREREIINRERTWLFCFCVDRSISGQMGKPWTIREDWIIRNSRHWGMQRLSKLYDMGLSALVELLRISTRQFDFLFSSTTTVSGLNTEIDYNTTLRIFNEQLNEWHDLWQALPSIDADHDRRTMHFITKQAPLRYNYAVLLLNSFGLQHAMDFPKRSGMDKGIYLSKCLEAAKKVVQAACEGMRPVLSYAPDTHFIILAYACVFLLKLTRPAFSAFVDEDEIINIVTTCADTLEEVSMDPTHMPMLYATFLRALLQSRQERSTRSGATTPYKSGAASPIDSTGQDDAAISSNGPNPENIANSLQGMSNAQDIQNADQAFINGQSIHSNPALRADHIDQLLNESFWSTLLPPGFGGPLDGLANGMV